MKNTIDKQYQDLLKAILEYGVEKKDRTGTGTKSIFGYTIRHNMKDGFPLLTTKKMAWKTMVTELIWFLRGDTNIKYLVDNGCNIWNGDAYKKYWFNWRPMKEDCGEDLTPFTQEEFINKIKTDEEFAKKWGELGPIYGKQWRSWKGFHEGQHDILKVIEGIEKHKDYLEGIDQIFNLINDLKTNPDSRRLMVNAWNVGELDQMTLPPCHYGFQVYTRELSREERWDLYSNRFAQMKPYKFKKMVDGVWVESTDEEDMFEYDVFRIPKRAISLMWNQRSVDTGLGLPFNIASYGLLLEIIAKSVNMVPDELIGNLGDTHLYLNHIEQAKEQIGRKYTPEERESMLKEAMSWRLYNKAVNELMPFGGGMSEYYDMHKIPYYTREPYPLPTLKMNPIFLANLEHKGFDEAINGQVNFELENYQSHPTIKAPLSN